MDGVRCWMQSYVCRSWGAYVHVGASLAFVASSAPRWRCCGSCGGGGMRQRRRSSFGTLTNAGNACHHGNSPEGCDVCWTNRSWRAGCTANQRLAVATTAAALQHGGPPTGRPAHMSSSALPSRCHSLCSRCCRH